jgi:hypothetical protein
MRSGAFLFAVSTCVFLALAGGIVSDRLSAGHLSVVYADTCQATTPNVAGVLSIASPLDQAHNGVPYPFTISLGSKSGNAQSFTLGYRVQYLTPEGGAVDVSDVALPGDYSTRNSLQHDETWDVPTAAPAGTYTITPYAVTGAGDRIASDVLTVTVLSDAGPRVYIDPTSRTSSALLDPSLDTLEYYYTLHNPSNADHQVQAHWSATEKVLASGKVETFPPRVLTVPAGDTVTISQHLNRAAYASMNVTAGVDDQGFTTSTSSNLAGQRAYAGVFVPSTYASDTTLGEPHFTVTGCLAPPSFDGTVSKGPLPQTGTFTLGSRQFSFTPSASPRGLSVSWRSLWTSPPAGHIRIEGSADTHSSVSLTGYSQKTVTLERGIYIALMLLTATSMAFTGLILVKSRRRYMEREVA